MGGNGDVKIVMAKTNKPLSRFKEQPYKANFDGIFCMENKWTWKMQQQKNDNLTLQFSTRKFWYYLKKIIDFSCPHKEIIWYFFVITIRVLYILCMLMTVLVLNHFCGVMVCLLISLELVRFAPISYYAKN